MVHRHYLIDASSNLRINIEDLTNTNKNELIYSWSLILTTGHTMLCPYTLSSKTSSSHLGFLTLHLVGYVSSRLNKIQYFLSLLLKTSANGKYLFQHDRYFNGRLYLLISINLVNIYTRIIDKVYCKMICKNIQFPCCNHSF